MSTPVTEDRTIVMEIVQWADRSGKMPGRNRVMDEFKIGATRATRLLAEADQVAADRSGPSSKPTGRRSGPRPDRTESEPGPGDLGPHGPDRSDGAELPTFPDQEIGPDPAETLGETGPDQADASDRALSDRALDRSDSGPDRQPADRSAPTSDRGPDQTDPGPVVEPTAGPDRAAGPVRTGPDRRTVWPVLLLALPAFVAIWSGWVGLGELTGFGPVHPLPGIWDDATINSAITLPIGVETYAAYALRVWLSGTGPLRARQFARASSIGSLLLGAAGQVAYHLMEAAGLRAAPWQITTLVACIPVAVLGMGAALAHLSGGHDR